MQNSFLRASNVYFILTLAIVAVTVIYGMLNFNVYRAEIKAIEDNKKTIDRLADSLNLEQSDFKIIAEAHSKKQNEVAKAIASILPPYENYTELTRQLDLYFAENDKQGNPIFQSSLRFGKSAPAQSLVGISALPVSMSIESTRDNFLKFLDFVSKSGSLDNGIRLMAIKSIQLNFTDGGEVIKDLAQKINFTVELEAYSQTPKVAR